MVGYRNFGVAVAVLDGECIRHSDGGVSEPEAPFRPPRRKCIRHSDGGVSELRAECPLCFS